MAAFDQALPALMRKWNLPGMTVAVAKDGKLILARGYGYSDFEARTPMQPDTMTRVASISKLITGAAILRLKDQGLLDLDQTFLSILTQYEVPAGGDARLRDIKLRHLLQHSEGWDKPINEDPTNQTAAVAAALRLTPPIACSDVIRYAVTQPLQFTPGSRVGYSNMGFCILGQVIARVSGQTYESYVRDHVLAPAGVNAMSIGHGRVNQRGTFEAKYYAYDGELRIESVFPGEGKVAPEYSVDPLTYEGSAGWIGSVVDLTRIMTAVDGSRMPAFLSADSRNQMVQNPQLPGVTAPRGVAAGRWFGLALYVGPTTDTFGHGGTMAGSMSILFREARGYVFAVATNGWASDTATLQEEMMSVMVQGIDAGLAGSGTDLYPQFPSASLPGRTP